VFPGYRSHGIGNCAVLSGRERILTKPCSPTHPNVDHYRGLIPGNSPGKGIGLQTIQAIESSFGYASVGSGNMGTQTLRHDAMSVLECLALVLIPSDPGRECRDYSASGFK
jgi:hypothetical protein